MRAKFTVVLALIVTLLLANLAISETIPEYISVVEIYVDSLTDANGVRILETTLMQEDGVAEVSHDLEKGIIAVTLSQDVGWVNLFDFVQRINGTRQYSVRKMDVIAVGHLVKFPVDYEGEVYDYGRAPYDGAYDYVADRYAFQLGDNYFLLAKDDMLNRMISSEYKTARVLGTVKTFSAGVPIMRLRDFQRPNDLEELSDPEEAGPFESHAISSENTQDRISWVKIQVDGMNCDVCVRRVEVALAGERGVDSVTADLETGTVVVIPKVGSEQIKLVNLISRINGTREYIAAKMTVVAEGRAVRLPVKYHNSDPHIHSHDRYKLQVGNTHFILSDNEKLHELLESGHERIRVAGTVSAFNDRVPIMAIGAFEEPRDKAGVLEYARSSDADILIPAKEEEHIPEKGKNARIESVRIYVDGLICNVCGSFVQRDMVKEEGVKTVVTDVGMGLIEIVPEAGGMFDLHSVRQRINAMRDYTVIRMDVIASGDVQEVTFVDHIRTFHSRPHSHKRYRLIAGEFGGFILAENEKLKEILESENRSITVVGTVTSFRGKIPILNIKEYKETEERPHS